MGSNPTPSAKLHFQYLHFVSMALKCYASSLLTQPLLRFDGQIGDLLIAQGTSILPASGAFVALWGSLNLPMNKFMGFYP